MNSKETKYTLGLWEIPIEKLFDFDFLLYGDTESYHPHKDKFIQSFYNYWYFEEINAETIEAFNLKLKRKITEYIDTYNELYEQKAKIFVENGKLYSTISNTNYTADIKETKAHTKDETEANVYQDTPMTNLSNTNYATSKNNNDKNTNQNENNTFIATNGEMHDEQKMTPFEFYDMIVKRYQDLDISFIKKFEECFLMIY